LSGRTISLVARFLGVSVLLIVAGCLVVARTSAVTDPRLPGTAERPGALLWGNGVFSSRSTFEQWLRKHHKLYRSWATLHPAGRVILENAARPLRFHRSQYAPAGPPAPPIAAPRARGSASNEVSLALAGFAALLIVLGASPLERFAATPDVAVRIRERRGNALAAGISILASVVLVNLIT
jgi:hypothetical protein